MITQRLKIEKDNLDKPTGNIVKDDQSLFVGWGHNYPSTQFGVENIWDNQMFADSKLFTVNKIDWTYVNDSTYTYLVTVYTNETIPVGLFTEQVDKVALTNTNTAFDGVDGGVIIGVTSNSLSFYQTFATSQGVASNFKDNLNGLVGIPSIEYDFAMLRLNGSNIIKTSFQLNQFMQDKNTFKTSQLIKLENFLNLAKKYDLYVIFCLQNTLPSWLESASDADKLLATKTFWQNIVTQFKNHPSIAWYNLMNKPNGSNHQSPVNWLRTIKNAIRRIDLNTPITLGVSIQSNDSNPFNMNNQDLRSLLDLYSIHQYVGANQSSAQQLANNLKNLANDRKPVALEEGAVATDVDANVAVDYIFNSKRYLCSVLNTAEDCSFKSWNNDPHKYQFVFDLTKKFMKDATFDDANKSIEINSANIPTVTGRRYLTATVDKYPTITSFSYISSSTGLNEGTYKYGITAVLSDQTETYVSVGSFTIIGIGKISINWSPYKNPENINNPNSLPVILYYNIYRYLDPLDTYAGKIGTSTSNTFVDTGSTITVTDQSKIVHFAPYETTSSQRGVTPLDRSYIIQSQIADYNITLTNNKNFVWLKTNEFISNESLDLNLNSFKLGKNQSIYSLKTISNLKNNISSLQNRTMQDSGASLPSYWTVLASTGTWTYTSIMNGPLRTTTLSQPISVSIQTGNLFAYVSGNQNFTSTGGTIFIQQSSSNSLDREYVKYTQYYPSTTAVTTGNSSFDNNVTSINIAITSYDSNYAELNKPIVGQLINGAGIASGTSITSVTLVSGSTYTIGLSNATTSSQSTHSLTLTTANGLLISATNRGLFNTAASTHSSGSVVQNILPSSSWRIQTSAVPPNLTTARSDYSLKWKLEYPSAPVYPNSATSTKAPSQINIYVYAQVDKSWGSDSGTTIAPQQKLTIDIGTASYLSKIYKSVVYRGEWQATSNNGGPATYNIDELVYYSGYIYKSLVNSNKSNISSTSNWKQMYATSGEIGSSGDNSYAWIKITFEKVGSDWVDSETGVVIADFNDTATYIRAYNSNYQSGSGSKYIRIGKIYGETLYVGNFNPIGSSILTTRLFKPKTLTTYKGMSMISVGYWGQDFDYNEITESAPNIDYLRLSWIWSEMQTQSKDISASGDILLNTTQGSTQATLTSTSSSLQSKLKTNGTYGIVSGNSGPVPSASKITFQTNSSISSSQNITITLNKPALSTATNVPIDLYLWQYNSQYNKRSSIADSNVLNAAKNNLKILGKMQNAPSWLGSYPDSAAVATSTNITVTQNFMKELANRYGPNGSLWDENPSVNKIPITWWEIGNEVNAQGFWPTVNGMPDPDSYAKFLFYSEQAIHNIDPDAIIITAGLSAAVAQTLISTNSSTNSVLNKVALADNTKPYPTTSDGDVGDFWQGYVYQGGIQKKFTYGPKNNLNGGYAGGQWPLQAGAITDGGSIPNSSTNVAYDNTLSYAITVALRLTELYKSDNTRSRADAMNYLNKIVWGYHPYSSIQIVPTPNSGTIWIPRDSYDTLDGTLPYLTNTSFNLKNGSKYYVSSTSIPESDQAYFIYNSSSVNSAKGYGTNQQLKTGNGNNYTIQDVYTGKSGPRSNLLEPAIITDAVTQMNEYSIQSTLKKIAVFKNTIELGLRQIIKISGTNISISGKTMLITNETSANLESIIPGMLVTGTDIASSTYVVSITSLSSTSASVELSKTPSSNSGASAYFGFNNPKLWVTEIGWGDKPTKEYQDYGTGNIVNDSLGLTLNDSDKNWSSTRADATGSWSWFNNISDNTQIITYKQGTLSIDNGTILDQNTINERTEYIVTGAGTAFNDSMVGGVLLIGVEKTGINLSTSTKNITVSNTSGIQIGMSVKSSKYRGRIDSGTTVSNINGNVITLSKFPLSSSGSTDIIFYNSEFVITKVDSLTSATVMNLSGSKTFNSNSTYVMNAYSSNGSAPASLLIKNSQYGQVLAVGKINLTTSTTIVVDSWSGTIPTKGTSYYYVVSPPESNYSNDTQANEKNQATMVDLMLNQKIINYSDLNLIGINFYTWSDRNNSNTPYFHGEAMDYAGLIDSYKFYPKVSSVDGDGNQIGSISAIPTTIASVSWNEDTNEITYTTNSRHSLTVNSTVLISGFLPQKYNGVYTVTALPSNNQFVINNFNVNYIDTPTTLGTFRRIKSAIKTLQIDNGIL